MPAESCSYVRHARIRQGQTACAGWITSVFRCLCILSCPTIPQQFPPLLESVHARNVAAARSEMRPGLSPPSPDVLEIKYAATAW